MGRGGPPVPMQGMPPSYGGGPMTGPNGGRLILFCQSCFLIESWQLSNNVQYIQNYFRTKLGMHI